MRNCTAHPKLGDGDIAATVGGQALEAQERLERRLGPIAISNWSRRCCDALLLLRNQRKLPAHAFRAPLPVVGGRGAQQGAQNGPSVAGRRTHHCSSAACHQPAAPGPGPGPAVPPAVLFDGTMCRTVTGSPNSRYSSRCHSGVAARTSPPNRLLAKPSAARSRRVRRNEATCSRHSSSSAASRLGGAGCPTSAGSAAGPSARAVRLPSASINAAGCCILGLGTAAAGRMPAALGFRGCFRAGCCRVPCGSRLGSGARSGMYKVAAVLEHALSDAHGAV